MKFSISVLKYLGKLKDGILVLLSIVYDNKYYEATFFYTDSDILLTISEKLEIELGYKIKEDPEYIDILRDILRKIIPYSEALSTVEPIL